MCVVCWHGDGNNLRGGFSCYIWMRECLLTCPFKHILVYVASFCMTSKLLYIHFIHLIKANAFSLYLFNNPWAMNAHIKSIWFPCFQEFILLFILCKRTLCATMGIRRKGRNLFSLYSVLVWWASQERLYCAIIITIINRVWVNNISQKVPFFDCV